MTSQISSKTDAYVGIDLAIAKGQRLPVCVCVIRNERLEPLDLRGHSTRRPPVGSGNKAALESAVRTAFAAETLTYLLKIADEFNLTIRRVAIDAPSSFRASTIPRRFAEVEMDKRGISCFTTPSEVEFHGIVEKAKRHLGSGGSVTTLPHANQIWMLVGFSLFEKLSEQFECIEVYPQAIAHALNASSEHKTTSGGLAAQLHAVLWATGWDGEEAAFRNAVNQCGFGAAHDKLDAFMSAWIASLDEQKRIACGKPPNDVIWIPQIEP